MSDAETSADALPLEALLQKCEDHATSPELAAPEALLRSLQSGVSAALVRLPPEGGLTMQRLHTVFQSFFSDTPDVEKAKCAEHTRQPNVGPASILVGWRRPSVAKELVRLFAAAPPSAVLPDQPWLVASKSLFARAAQRELHAVLSACLQVVLQALSGDDVSPEMVASLLGGSTGEGLVSNCALDIFFYPNDDVHASGVPNCTEHVDRGFLSAVVVSPVPGLELWDGERGEFRAVNDIWPHALPWRDVVVFVNDELERMAADSRWSARSRLPGLVACTHAVRKAAAPRLSISYELRPGFGAALPSDWLAGELAQANRPSAQVAHGGERNGKRGRDVL